MTTIKPLHIAAALVAVAGIGLVLSDLGGARAEGRGEPRRRVLVVKGTGTFSTEVDRTAQALDPPCVSLITRQGQIAFTGLITNTLANGHQEGNSLLDECATPAQGTTRRTWKLRNATVAGRTGDLVFQATGIFDGSAALAPGARLREHFTVRGTRGALAGASGEGESVGLATVPPVTPTVASTNTYWATIRLPNPPLSRASEDTE